jgi:nitroreductase
VDDATLYRILDHARFAPSGGNRQGWRVLVVRDADIRREMKALMQPTVRQYKAQMAAGETPFNTIKPSRVTEQTVRETSPRLPLVDNLEDAPLLLVVCVDLSLVTSFDAGLNRVGVISGASIYPFVWNVLLGARNEGLGGVLTTFLAHQEPAAKALLHIPEDFAIAAMVAIGKPVKQLTRLRRAPVASFTWVDTFDGEPFQP